MKATKNYPPVERNAALREAWRQVIARAAQRQQAARIAVAALRREALRKTVFMDRDLLEGGER